MKTAFYFGGQLEPASPTREPLYCTRSGIPIAEYVVIITQHAVDGITTWWQCPLCNRWHQQHTETRNQQTENME